MTPNIHSPLLAFLLLAVSTQNSLAAPHQHREHGAHEHGVATLTLAFSDQDISVELDTPAVNLLGFEHAPATDSERQAVKTAADQLNFPLSFLSLPPAAHCVTKKVVVKSALLEALEKDKAPPSPHTHGDDDHDPEGHADFNAKYTLQCQAPKAIDIIGVQLFTTFKGIEKINAQWLTGVSQSAKTLTPSDHTINLR